MLTHGPPKHGGYILTITFLQTFICNFVVILSPAKSPRYPSYVNMTLQRKRMVTFLCAFMLHTMEPQRDKNNELGFTASEYSEHPILNRVFTVRMNITKTSPCYEGPLTPHLYSKTEVYRGMHYFLIFALKHRLWVLVRTSVRRF